MPRLRLSRRQKLVRPRLQLALVGAFVGLSAAALLLQFLVLSLRLTSAAGDLDAAGGRLTDVLPELLTELAVLSVAVLLPAISIAGVFLTFRLAGPIHRFEAFLRSVSSGEQIGPCKIRDDDELQELCDLINEATEPLRRRERTGSLHDGRSSG